MPIPLKPPAWQRAIGHQSTGSLLQDTLGEARTQAAGSGQQGLALGCWRTGPSLAQRASFQGAEQTEWPGSGGRGARANWAKPTHAAHSAVGRRYALRLLRTVPGPLCCQLKHLAPWALRLLIASAP